MNKTIDAMRVDSFDWEKAAEQLEKKSGAAACGEAVDHVDGHFDGHYDGHADGHGDGPGGLLC
jgi:hypothetical protein